MLLFFQIYYYIIFGRIILSYFFRFGVNQSSGWAGIYRIFYGLTEPLLAPIRRLVPMIRAGAGFIDLSTVILLVLLGILQRLVYVYL